MGKKGETIVEGLPDGELDGYIAEAEIGGESLEPTLRMLVAEKRRRRALLLAATEMDATGAVDALQEPLPTNPIHVDQHWQVDYHRQDFDDD